MRWVPGNSYARSPAPDSMSAEVLWASGRISTHGRLRFKTVTDSPVLFTLSAILLRFVFATAIETGVASQILIVRSFRITQRNQSVKVGFRALSQSI